METNNTEREFYPLTDEDGVEHIFELIGACEIEGNQYYAFVPTEGENGESEYLEYVILKSVMNGEDEDLVSIDDDKEFDKVADCFDELFASQIDYDAVESDK